MDQLVKIEREVREVKSMLRQILPAHKKENWVGYSVIQEITPWKTGEKLRWARDNNLVQYDSKKGYLLQSIPDQFLVK
jgi:hypothetical protein